MDLTKHYEGIACRIKQVDFGKLWLGFKPYRFALYDDEQVILDGERIPKTDAFTGNTAIPYEGAYIAIWKLVEDLDPDVLASKLSHEMFHAFQHERGEKRFPNEMEAVQRYTYSAEYLQIKHDENRLLVELMEHDDGEKLQRLLGYRKYRQGHNPYEYNYEAMIEAIEGSAQYVEYHALRQLDERKAKDALDTMCQRVGDIKRLIPARIQAYDVGALMLMIGMDRGIKAHQSIGSSVQGFCQCLVDEAKMPEVVPEVTTEIQEYYDADQRKLKELVECAKKSPAKIITGDYELLGFNVYSAREYEGYLYSQYFVMIRDDGKEQILYGDFVLRLEDDRVKRIYRMDDSASQ